MGRVLSARRTILYLLSFQGYLPILEAFRLLHRHVEIVTGNSKRSAASSSSGSVFERSDDMASGNWCELFKAQNKCKKRDDRKNSDDPSADHLDWLEDLKENLVDTELHASAHIVYFNQKSLVT